MPLYGAEFKVIQPLHVIGCPVITRGTLPALPLSGDTTLLHFRIEGLPSIGPKSDTLRP